MQPPQQPRVAPPRGPRVAFITGITGQDGSYLAELLVHKGYVVHGMVRRSSRRRLSEFLKTKCEVGYGDVLDVASIMDALTAIKALRPAVVEVYNLAAQSHVHASFEMPLYTAQTDGIGTLNVLECLRRAAFECPVRVCHASTSEMFGASPPPQSEATPFHPRSPYGVSKLFAYWAVRNYREAYGMFACNCIAFNHESERRDPSFVTRKITTGVARVVAELASHHPPAPIRLGNLDARRDWSHAFDVVRAMWAMLQLDAPDDYVVSSNSQRSVREFVDAAFHHAGMHLEWRGEGMEEHAVLAGSEDVVVVVDPKYMRPAEVDSLQGDCTKLREATGWRPTIDFDKLVARMVQHDLRTYFVEHH